MRHFGFPLVLPFLVFGVTSCIFKDTDVHPGNQELDSRGTHDDSDTEEPEQTDDEVSDGSDEPTDGSDTDRSEEPDDEVTEEPDPTDETEDSPVVPEPDASPDFPPGPTATTPDGGPSPSNTAPAPVPTEPQPTTPPSPTTSPTTPPNPTTTPTTPTEGSCNSWNVSSNGYVRVPGAGGNCWNGYAFTYIGAEVGNTISPADFASCGENCQLCISGTLAPTPDSSAWAALGFTLNEGVLRNLGLATPDAGPIGVNVTNRGGTLVRVYLIGPGGGGGDSYWCANIRDQSGALPLEWESFNTECWDGGVGMPYSGEPIRELRLVTRGEKDNAVPFDICLNSVTPP